jgi:ketosteroid isomerase-like protein
VSRENVEAVRQAYEAWNSGDMQALRELYHPDASIVRGLDGWPGGEEPTVGREAVIRGFEQNRDALDADMLEPLSFTDAGDRVVVRHRWRGTGRGPALRMEFTVVCTLREGRIFLLENYWDHTEALEAVENSEVVRQSLCIEPWEAQNSSPSPPVANSALRSRDPAAIEEAAN